MGVPTRLTQGLATQAKTNLLGNYPLPSPFRTSSTPTTSYQSGYAIATYATEFMHIDNGWTATSSTFATTDAVGGIAVMTPSTTGTACSVHRTSGAFQFVAGQKFWFQTRFDISAVSSATQVDGIGLMKSSGGTLATSDSLLFTKAAGSTSLSLVSTVGSTATTLATGLATLTSGTYIDAGFYYNGTDIEVFINDALVARVTTPTIGSSATTLTNALLVPTLTLTPVTTETINIDYLLTAQELAR